MVINDEVNYFYDNNYIDCVIIYHNVFLNIREFVLNIFKKNGDNL